MMTQPPDHPERVGEAIAQHLLARAATLDTDGFSLDQLRQAAAEAGISTAAFDAAVAEWRARSRSSSRPTLEKRLTGALLRNAVSFAATWVAMTALISLQRLIVGPAVMPDLIIITSLAAGAIISTRLRARVATILLGGLAVSQGAELLMALASGRPEIHGFGAHMALMIAGVAGVGIGIRLSRQSTPEESGDRWEEDVAGSIPDDARSRPASHEDIRAEMRVIEALA